MRFPWRRIWQNPGELLLPGLQDMATRALLYRRPAEPATLLVKHGSQVFAIRLRPHPPARRYNFRIHSTDPQGIPVHGGGSRCAGQAGLDPRPVEPLGVMHVSRIAVVFLAIDPRAALCAGLSRRP